MSSASSSSSASREGNGHKQVVEPDFATPAKQQDPSARQVSITSVVPFSSLAMVAVIALLKPDQFQDMIAMGTNMFGVSAPLLIGTYST
jgi:hypothetical protein